MMSIRVFIHKKEAELQPRCRPLLHPHLDATVSMQIARSHHNTSQKAGHLKTLSQCQQPPHCPDAKGEILHPQGGNELSHEWR